MKRILSNTIVPIVTIVTVISISQPASAQKQWTLRQCTEYAISHNLTVKQKDNTRRKQELQLSTAKNSRLPNLEGNVGESFSFGRGLTMDNTYTNRSTSSTTFGLSTAVPLFTGFEIPNTIKLNQLKLEAATEDLEKAKNDIRMQVAKAYVQILYDMELADVAWRQVSIDSMQVARLTAFVQNGKASEAELSQQKATQAQSRLTATQADNNLQLALLALSQLLELSTPEGFAVVRPDAPFNSLVLPSPEIVFAEAMAFKPEVKAEQLRLNAAEKNIKIAQSDRYPYLYLSGGLQTNYYKTSGIDAESFSSQLKNNFSQYIGLNLNIPIFNRFATRNNIRSARIDHENQQLQLDNVKKTLYKEIQQVYYNAVAAQAKHASSEAARQSSQDAFVLAQAKYENGKATITEFNEAKNRYLKAESDLVQARYEYLYQTTLLDFYRGKDLNF
ncbi:MAG: TolC family protein [Prevotella sp.]|nr:TolC family protein [Prevotella sp.]MBQ8716207.1 TolC family protein [Prevotella sp.]